MKAAIIYWSSTGNTEAMAQGVKEGINSNGNEVELFEASSFSKDKVDEFDAFAFGCPAMGAEELEDSEFQPMWDEVKPLLANKPVVLFGSYDWGDGEWMRTWESEARDLGLNIVSDGLIVNNDPDDDALNSCKELGKKL